MSFGWTALDNLPAIQTSTSWENAPGNGTAWSKLVDWLEEKDKWLASLSIYHLPSGVLYTMPWHADQYAIHYRACLTIGSKGTTQSDQLVASAVQGNKVTLCVMDDSGKVQESIKNIVNVELLKPSPLAKGKGF